MLRMWHLDEDDNYVLTLFDIDTGKSGANAL
jgi:hypothetical protein